jgi:hypothetical protein
LVTTLDVNARAYFNAVVIFSRDSSGKVTSAEIRGSEIRDLGRVVRDLNGDGKHELIIPTQLTEYSSAETVTWPAVYRLENGKYVEVSRDFPHFYDQDVLPEVKKPISGYQAGAGPPNPARQYALTELIMRRNQILRVLGRDPAAGLQDAREWMKSGDPRFLQAAAATFQSIGGHEDELRAATEAWERARERERAAHQSN